MTDQSALREKLRQIRDSDHPASPWARNVVQTMDELKADPNDPVLIRQLGKNVAMLERMMNWAMPLSSDALTPDEIAAIFGLGRHSDDHPVGAEQVGEQTDKSKTAATEVAAESFAVEVRSFETDPSTSKDPELATPAQTSQRGPQTKEDRAREDYRTIRGFIESQEPLGAEFDRVLFDNVWDLYAR